jgi:endonuclease YncB( thermonuclease family)
VHDGDTLTVRQSDGSLLTFRHAGVRAPKGDEPYAQESLAAHRQLVEGKTVFLDPWGAGAGVDLPIRLVYVDCACPANASLVRQGQVYAVPEEIKGSQYGLALDGLALAYLERQARLLRLGLWKREGAPASHTPASQAISYQLKIEIAPNSPVGVTIAPTAPDNRYEAGTFIAYLATCASGNAYYQGQGPSLSGAISVTPMLQGSLVLNGDTTLVFGCSKPQ